MKLHLSYANVCCLLMALLFAAPVFSQSNIPQMINYQGYLTDAEGKAVGTDTYTLSFSIYPAVDATTPVWGPKVMENVPVVDGHFNVILGPTDGATDTAGKSIALAFTGAEAYLGIKVEKVSNEGEGESTVAAGEIAPRQRILSTPYAMNGVPAGTIVAFGGPMENVPPGWCLCDNSLKAIADYPALYKAIGKSWGGDDTHFRVPDLRGRFLRGQDMGTKRDPDRDARTASEVGGNAGDKVGTIQDDATSLPVKSFWTAADTHKHKIYNRVQWRRICGCDSYFVPMSAEGADGSQWPDWYTEKETHKHEIDSGGDKETRPANANVVFIIKY